MPPYRETAYTVRRRAAMQARLVTAARVRFAAQGFAATTMQQVVADAGTSVGNLYFYFANKDALLRAVVEEIAMEIGVAIDASVAQVPPGAARLAVAVVEGGRVTLEREQEMARYLLDATQPALRGVFLANFTKYLREFVAERMPDANLALIEAAWQGAIFRVGEVVVGGEVVAEAVALGRFLARWNLQALGLPRKEVDDALAALDRWLGAGGENSGVLDT